MDTHQPGSGAPKGDHTGYGMAETDRAQPTDRILRIIQRISSLPLVDLALHHFDTPDSPEGHSLLVTMVVNNVSTLRPDLGEPQLARLATHAVVRHPSTLLSYLVDTGELKAFAVQALASRPVSLQAKLVCPMDTPYLITDISLREQLGQLQFTPALELRRIITPFLQCFYPGNWEVLEQVIRRAADSLLQAFITDPGALHSYLVNQQQLCPFSPPRWINLSDIPKPYDEPDDDWDTEEELEGDRYFCPLTAMGWELDEFMALTSEQQKRMVMSKLPRELTPIMDDEIAAQVMHELREMEPQSIVGALEPTLFFQLVEHTKKKGMDTTQHRVPSPGPRKYRYRFRLETLTRGGHSWEGKSAGTLLRHWLNGWIPLFLASGFEFTLTTRPLERDSQTITILSPSGIPSAEILETFTLDPVIRRKVLVKFDIWFVTDCGDVSNNGAQSFVRSSEFTQLYNTEVKGNAIWSLKMERLIFGFVPCIMLERSLMRDEDARIKLELQARTDPRLNIDPSLYEVEWITIRTQARRTQVMAKCIVTDSNHHSLVSKLWTAITGRDAIQHPVTFDYSALIIPHPQMDQFDQELNQAIVRHMGFLHTTTSVLFTDLPNRNPFIHVPTLALLGGFPGINTDTIVTLLTQGVLTGPDGSQLKSPVTRVTTDRNYTRLYLHGNRSQAEQLIRFAQGLLPILPLWMEHDIPDIKLDTKEAEKSLHITHAAITAATSTTETTHTSGTTATPTGLATAPQTDLDTRHDNLDTTDHANLRIATLETKFDQIISILSHGLIHPRISRWSHVHASQTAGYSG